MKSIRKQIRSAALVAFGVAGIASAAYSAGLSEADARRFLGQATFGPNTSSVNALVGSTRELWLQRQFSAPPAAYTGFGYTDPNANKGCPAGAPNTCRRDYYSLFPLQVQFFRNAMTGQDQLRQRVALALSEILVTSGQQIRQPYAMANYQRIFLANAFGNFKDILRAVTLSPAMGNYLNMANNDKPNPARGTQPNENYAREVLQLFSIGAVQLNADGTPKLDTQGAPLPSYDQSVVEGYAHAFTGWTYAPRPAATSKFPNPQNFEGEMVAFADHHDTDAKTLLNGTVLPAGQGASADLQAAMDSIFQHPNVGPFIGRQLIQQLVTSNPSPAYVARVSAAFNGQNGGHRGDMKNVLSAILLDPEAANPSSPSTFGKLREPIVQLTHLLRALNGQSDGVWLQAKASALGEPVFSPPTVFSFFSPDYALPDDPGLEGPAFGVYNASMAFVLSGVMATALSPTGVAPDTTVPGAFGTKIDLSSWQALAGKPAALTSEINRVFFAKRMSVALQQAVTSAAAAEPASKPEARARAALFLAVMSSEYLVEH